MPLTRIRTSINRRPLWILQYTAVVAMLATALVASALLLIGAWGDTAPTAAAFRVEDPQSAIFATATAVPAPTEVPAALPTSTPEPSPTATPAPTSAPRPAVEQIAPPPQSEPEVRPVVPTATQLPPPPPPPAACPTAPLTGYATDLFVAVNNERRAAGLPGLAVDGCAVYVAQIRSDDMATVGYFSHTSPTGETAFSLLDGHGVPHGWAGENLARNNYPNDETVAVAIRDLMASPGHRDNILSYNYTKLGVAVAFDDAGMKYFTMIFMGPP